MNKKTVMDEWENLPAGQNPLEWMEPVDPKMRGSKFGLDGMRIEGSPVFIDAVLSNLKGLLEGENEETRLMVMRTTVGDCSQRLPPGEKERKCNAPDENEVMYLRLVSRGAT